MDSAQTITHISHCYGYGGIDLALERIFGDRIRTIAACEIEAFAVWNGLAKCETGKANVAFPFWTNLKTFPFAEFHDRVSIYSAGFPCQPFSAAGKRATTEDPRHLYPFIADGISAMLPALVFLENVEGIISAKCCNQPEAKDGESVLLYVLRDLEKRGYRATWGIFSASEVGAPHQRKRVFILAYRADSPKLAHHHHHQRSQGRDSAELRECSGERVARTSHPPVAHSTDARCLGRSGQEQYVCGQPLETARLTGRDPLDLWPARPGERQHEWEPARTVSDTERTQRAIPSRGHDRDRANFGREEATSRSPQHNQNHVKRQIESPMGGDIDGNPSGLDYANLCVSCDSRIDELRMLGNGVVPATAERAFRILATRLQQSS